MKYFVYRGMDKVEVEGDSVGVRLPNGDEFELTLRQTDGELELSLNRPGQLVIEPRACNQVYLRKAER